MASEEERDRIMAEYLAQAGEQDEDSEAEFDPSAQNDDDDEDDDDAFEADDDDDEEEEDYILLKGTIARHDGRLIYKGHVLADTFELKSKEDGLHWSVHHPTKTSAEENNPSRMRTIEMEGNIGKKSVKVDLTLTEQVASTNGKSDGGKKGQADDDDMKKPASVSQDDNESKIPSKSEPTGTAYVYSVFGKGTDGSEAFEFYGQLEPSTAKHATMPLECKKRTVSAAPAAATAAAAAVPADEEDEDEDDADEGMDYDELIALHEDAGMSVEELRKRYHAGGDAGIDDEDAKPAAKKPRTEQEEDSDDGEYGF